MIAPSIWPNGASAALTITFDDGYADTYCQTAAWLADRGHKATYYVISRRVGAYFERLPTATWHDWRCAAQMGHEVASHSATHSPMAGPLCDVRRILLGILDSPDRRAFIRQSFQRARALRGYRPDAETPQERVDPLLEPSISRREIRRQLPGCRVSSFSYPAGRLDRAARRAVADAGYLSARGNQVGVNPGVSSPYALRNICLGPGLMLKELEPWLLRAVGQRGWLILTFHLVSNDNTAHYPYHCSVPDFQRIVERIERLPFWVASQQAVVEHCGMSAPG